MTNDQLVSHESASQPRRAYEPPKLTVHGTVADLTRDPQSRPLASNVAEAEVLFLGDDA